MSGTPNSTIYEGGKRLFCCSWYIRAKGHINALHFLYARFFSNTNFHFIETVLAFIIRLQKKKTLEGLSTTIHGVTTFRTSQTLGNA